MIKYIIFTILLSVQVSTLWAQKYKGYSRKQLHAAERSVMKRLGEHPKMFDAYIGETKFPVRLERVACGVGRVNLYCDDKLSRVSMREELTLAWEQMVRDTLGKGFEKIKVGIYCEKVPIERYIPNLFREKYAPDIKRYATPKKTIPLTSNTRGESATKGLTNTHIALWASHGYYYDIEEKKWQFQRPALYGTIEDLHSYTYVNDYLAPMLEAAGAVVVMPRERDTSCMEVIVDSDKYFDDRCHVSLSPGWTTHKGGFMQQDSIISENPFELGTYSLSPSNGGCATYEAWIDS